MKEKRVEQADREEKHMEQGEAAPPDPNRRKRGRPDEEEKKERIREVKRWRNQIKMKLTYTYTILPQPVLGIRVSRAGVTPVSPLVRVTRPGPPTPLNCSPARSAQLLKLWLDNLFLAVGGGGEARPLWCVITTVDGQR